MTPERDSPTLDYLEQKKQDLLLALQGDISLDTKLKEILKSDNDAATGKTDINEQMTDNNKKETDSNLEKNAESKTTEIEINTENVSSFTITQQGAGKDATSSDNLLVPENLVNSEPKTGQVKTTSYGTPLLNSSSPFVKLPSDDKFSKDICDVINFENLPNSIGKYKKISTLLKKVKSQVDRIQDS